MCGACGSGRVRGPWEDAVAAPAPSVRRSRAAVLTRLLARWRWRVEPWGTGYVVHGPLGTLPPADGVDDVVARAAAARPGAFGTLVPAGDGLGPAEAVVRASVLAWRDGGARVSGPGVPHAVLVHAHGRGTQRSGAAARDAWLGCPVALVPGAGAWRVARRVGDGARPDQ